MTRVQADRLLFHRKSGRELKIYYEKDRLPGLTSGAFADLAVISKALMREGLRAWRIDDPTRTPKQRLASARAHIRARAAQSRPKLRRP